MPLAIKAFEICSPWEAAHGRLQRGVATGCYILYRSVQIANRAGPQNLHPGSHSSAFSSISSSSSLIASIPRRFTIFKKRPSHAHMRLLLFIRTACRTSMLHRSTTAPRFLEGHSPMNTSSLPCTLALEANMFTNGHAQLRARRPFKKCSSRLRHPSNLTASGRSDLKHVFSESCIP
jgi:hypothetical protein